MSTSFILAKSVFSFTVSFFEIASKMSFSVVGSAILCVFTRCVGGFILKKLCSLFLVLSTSIHCLDTVILIFMSYTDGIDITITFFVLNVLVTVKIISLLNHVLIRRFGQQAAHRTD